jgi:predicted negative regulator of RcsB-dependent stress response
MWVLKYWKYIGVALAVLSVIGALLYYGHTKYHEGYDKAFSECEAQKQRTIDDRQKTREKQNRVIRPDTPAYIKRLREETA